MHKRNPIWWMRRSALGRCLTDMTVSTVLLCIALAVDTAEALGDRSTAEDVQIVSRQAAFEDICFRPECIHTASTILKNMDSEVEPCDDFYRFACGGFLKSTFIPDGKDSVDIFSVINVKLQEQLRASIEEPSNPNEQKPFKLVKNLYKSCMNKTAIEDQGLEPLHKILKKFGGWPVLDGEMWNDADFDWISSIYKFHAAGYSLNNFFSFKVIAVPKIKTRRFISLDTANLGLSYEYLSKGLGNKFVKAYYNYMVDIAILMGAERERAITELKESLLFEISLANISRTIDEQINSRLSYNHMTLDKLMNNYTSIPWREYFDKLLPNNITVEENEIVIVNVPSFISDLEKLLYKTPKRVQANYVIWRAVKDSVRYLNDDIRKRQLAYLTALNDKTVIRSRRQECVDLVHQRLPVGFGAMYVRKYFSKEAKQNVVDMVMNIKKQFYMLLQQAEWMDNRTRQGALERTAAISSFIAYPDELMDDTKLEKFYKNLELSGENFFDSILNLTIFNVEYSLGQLREPVITSDWVRKTRPAAVLVEYQWGGNSIDFSAGVLQDLLFNNDRPRYMNYGGIGTVIGHEIARAFDYLEHMEYMLTASKNLSDWPSTKKNYLKRVECIIQQYGNYTVEDVGLQLDGVKTRNENIADIVGIKTAYLAYNDWVKMNKPEQKLPGLPYSPNQMFWIAAANPLCAKWKLEALKSFITRTRQSLNKFRIVGSVSNMPEFSKDFNCAIGSKMNPEKKCSVW